MFVFKILLIILIALPVVALGTYFYVQMLSFIKDRNRQEQEAIRRSLGEPGTRTAKRPAGRRNNSKKDAKVSKKRRKNRENGQQK